METRDIVIDGDHILYKVTESQLYKNGLGGKAIGEKLDMTQYKEHFMRIVEDYVLTAEVESICYKWVIGKVIVVMSDNTNFRYSLYPEYKKDRPSSPELRKKLKKWAMKKYHFEPNTEADDVVAYWVRKGAIGFTTDKDLFKGVKGIWYNAHYSHMCWVRTTKEEAEHFFKCQILAGDLGDGIPSIDGVGLKTAEKLMLKYGNSYQDILSIFQDPSKVLGKKHRPVAHTKDYMVTMTRLVCMSQWSPKKGIQLWEFPNE